MADFATETRRGFDQVVEQFRIMTAEARERAKDADAQLERVAAEDCERGKALDERIDRLVSGIGEFMRAQHPPR